MRAMDSRRDFTPKKVFPGYFSELSEKANPGLTERARGGGRERGRQGGRARARKREKRQGPVFEDDGCGMTDWNIDLT